MDTYISHSHLFFVVHIVDSQAALVDKGIDTWLLFDQQFFWMNMSADDIERVENLIEGD